MAFATIRFKGDSIEKRTAINALLPEGRGPFPVLYLLHGLSDDYSVWCRRTALERHAEGRRLIIVMPDGGRSFYTNDPRPGGMAYEDHIIKDVIGLVDRTFPTIAKRSGRAVAGFSMGGYGAMMLGMKYTNKFAAACSHSGAFQFAHKAANWVDIDSLADSVKKRDYDVYSLARQLAKSSRKIALKLHCGTEDFLIEHTRSFSSHLEKLGITHQYDECPGDHSWGYMDRNICDTLDFVQRNTAKK